MASFRISVEKGYLSFSAGHFLVFGEKCERLHGHNYAVAVGLEGSLNEIGYVFDFVDLKKIASAECDLLDHKMLLPENNPSLRIEESEADVGVTFGSKRFSFPKEDVVVLPVDNITAELLAFHISGGIAERLRKTGATNLTALSVRVDEAPGQSATYRLEL
ncbi:MAG: 6-pyruvoyl trahydropterin synthase family protein [Candidatus Aquicultorales bacterium]